MNQGDSFYTLSGLGQTGLVLLSLALSVAVLGLAWRAMQGRSVVVRIAIALAVFAAFVWLSPQVYYTYYLTLFDGLPWQSVIKRPPDPLSLFKTLSFTGRTTLSEHSQGALGWLLIALAGFRRRAVSGSAPDDRA